MTTRNRLLLAACVCFAAGCGGSEPDADGFVRESGTLSGSDEELVSGEFADDYTVSAQPGEWIEVAMTSSELDPYVILRPPSCPEGGTCETQVDNDDFVGGNGAFVWHEADEAGRWTVIATSAEPGEEGAYEVAYRVAPAGGAPATPGVALGSGRTERGELADGDATLGSQEYVDTYGFVGRAGEGVSVDLRSSAFDPYLILQMPGEDQLDNDDWEGARDRARIEHTLTADGMYRVLVTSYRPGESGPYTLEIRPGEASSEGAAGEAAASGAAPSEDGADPFAK